MKFSWSTCACILLTGLIAPTVFAQSWLCFPDGGHLGAKPNSPPPVGVCVPENNEAARLLQYVDPVYPAITGRPYALPATIVLRAEIGPDGRVAALEYVSGPEEFMKSAMEAVAKWRYRPALADGHATVVYTTVSVRFPSLAGTSAPLPNRIQVSGPVEAKSLVHRVFPIYPADAAEHGQTGTIIFRAIIGTDGAVKELHYISGPKVFQEAAFDAVSAWRYKPLQVSGRPVEVETTIRVVFKF